MPVCVLQVTHFGASSSSAVFPLLQAVLGLHDSGGNDEFGGTSPFQTGAPPLTVERNFVLVNCEVVDERYFSFEIKKPFLFSWVTFDAR